MGKIILLLSLLFQITVNAQFVGETRFPVKGEQVTVNDWGSLALYLLSNTYFSETRDSIIAKIGLKEFEDMEHHCSVAGWPEKFYAKDGKDDGQDFEDRLNRLKMYKIAVYTHIFNGTTFDRYAIVRVPYSENKSWDPDVSWENNLYFLLKEKDVRRVN